MAGPVATGAALGILIAAFPLPMPGLPREFFMLHESPAPEGLRPTPREA